MTLMSSFFNLESNSVRFNYLLHFKVFLNKKLVALMADISSPFFIFCQIAAATKFDLAVDVSPSLPSVAVVCFSS